MAIVGHIKLFLTILFIYLFFILELDWLDLHSFTSCGVHWPVHSLTLTFFVPHVDLEKNMRCQWMMMRIFFEWTMSLSLHVLVLLNRWSASCHRVCLANMGRRFWQHNISGKPFSYHALQKICLALFFVVFMAHFRMFLDISIQWCFNEVCYLK